MNKVSQYFCIFCDFTTDDIVRAFYHYKSHMFVKHNCEVCDHNNSLTNFSNTTQSNGKCDHLETQLNTEEVREKIEIIDAWINKFLTYQNELMDKTYSSLLLSDKVCVECAVCRYLVENYKKNGGEMNQIQYINAQSIEQHCFKHLQYNNDSQEIRLLDVFIEECCDTFFTGEHIINDILTLLNDLSNDDNSVIDCECLSISKCDDSSPQLSPVMSREFMYLSKVMLNAFLQQTESNVDESGNADTNNGQLYQTTDNAYVNLNAFLVFGNRMLDSCIIFAVFLLLFNALIVCTSIQHNRSYLTNVEQELQTCKSGINNITNQLNTTILKQEFTESKINFVLQNVIPFTERINKTTATMNSWLNFVSFKKICCNYRLIEMLTTNNTYLVIDYYTFIILLLSYLCVSYMAITFIAKYLKSKLMYSEKQTIDRNSLETIDDFNIELEKVKSDFGKQLAIKNEEFDRLNTEITEIERLVTAKLDCFDRFVENTILKFEKIETEINITKSEIEISKSKLKKSSDKTRVELIASQTKLDNIQTMLMRHKSSIQSQIEDYTNTNRKEMKAINRELSIAVIHPATITYFAPNTAPIGWLKASGQSVSRTVYAKLFHTIGTKFGCGDGYSTFNLPDLRHEFIRCRSGGRDVDKSSKFGSFQLKYNVASTSDDPKSRISTLLACIKF